VLMKTLVIKMYRFQRTLANGTTQVIEMPWLLWKVTFSTAKIPKNIKEMILTGFGYPAVSQAQLIKEFTVEERKDGKTKKCI